MSKMYSILNSLSVLKISAIVTWSLNSNEFIGRGKFSIIPPYKLFASILKRKKLGCFESLFLRNLFLVETSFFFKTLARPPFSKHRCKFSAISKCPPSVSKRRSDLHVRKNASPERLLALKY